MSGDLPKDESIINWEFVTEDVTEDAVLCDNVEIDNKGAKKKEFPAVTNEDKMKEEPRDQLSESLRQLQTYNSNSSSDSDSEDDSEQDSTSSSSSSSSSSNSSSANSEGESEPESEEVEKVEVTSKKKNSKRKKPVEETWLSILGVDDKCTELPDIASLDLNDDDKFVHIGNFDNIIDKIVTVNGIPGMPTCDLDTLLFLEGGKKVLGYIIDVMGPVTAPVYIVPCSGEIVENLQLQKGTKVYCAPGSKYTKYVVIGDLMKIRGSDASWVGDVEVPPEFQEFSDDEQERLQKAAKKDVKRKLKEVIPNTDRLPCGSRTNVNKFHTSYPSRGNDVKEETKLHTSNSNRGNNIKEETKAFHMNTSSCGSRTNELNVNRFETRNHSYMGSRGPPQPPTYQHNVRMSPFSPHNQYVMNPAAFAARNTPPVILPPFDPTVPPPNFRPFLPPPARPMFPPFHGPPPNIKKEQ